MKLLRVDSVLTENTLLILEEHIAAKPRYAILSHTWAKDEVLYQHVLDNTARQRQGFAKILYTAQQAWKDKLEYIWVDTCCIDKSSSAELQEAINSMYGWYSEAQVCYAYLSNVTNAADTEEGRAEFVNSRWFTRGWTLQELLAPERIMFYSAGWEFIGVRSISFVSSLVDNERALHNEIAVATGIRKRWIVGGGMRSASIAERMSWASSRKTTRVEDVAYSLLGIFDVNMPLLYGEGSKAFLRLQEEIMKESDDQTVFAWTRSDGKRDNIAGLLAPSPDCFKAYRTDQCDIRPTRMSLSSPYLVTNKGLQIELAITEVRDGNGIVLAALDCTWGNRRNVALILKRLSVGTNQYVRILADRLGQIDVSNVGKHETLFVRQHLTVSEWRYARMWMLSNTTRYLLRAQNSQSTRSQFLVIKTASSSSSTQKETWSEGDSIFGHDIFCEDEVAAAAVSYRHKESQDEILLMFGNLFHHYICFDACWMPESTRTERSPKQSPDLLASAPSFNAHIPGEAVVLRSEVSHYIVNAEVLEIENGTWAGGVTSPLQTVESDDNPSAQEVQTKTFPLEVDIRREDAQDGS